MHVTISSHRKRPIHSSTHPLITLISKITRGSCTRNRIRDQPSLSHALSCPSIRASRHDPRRLLCTVYVSTRPNGSPPAAFLPALQYRPQPALHASSSSCFATAQSPPRSLTILPTRQIIYLACVAHARRYCPRNIPPFQSLPLAPAQPIPSHLYSLSFGPRSLARARS